MSAALLLAETEPDTRGYLKRQLSDDGFQVLGGDPNAVEHAQPDLVLLGASSLELCRRIREGRLNHSWKPDVPVIVLGTIEADAVDRVRAFDRGCDDYLPEPIVYAELVARIRAVLRRTLPPRAERLRVAEIAIDHATRRVTVAGERVTLAGREYELLLKLASDPHRVFTKEELLRDVWGFRSPGRTRTLDSHASRLRRKLARAGAGPFVLNEWGVGYRLLDP